MIEMSLDKETVLPLGSHTGPRGMADCSGGGGALDAEGAGLNDTGATPLLRQNKRRSTGGPGGSGSKPPGPGKRRRRANSESDSVLPSNFLLGGNIFDPLNLNSLLDEEVSRAINAATPASSPLPAKGRDPVEILVPRDITDPLSLNSEGEALLSPQRRRRHRNRHHHAQLHPSDLPARPALPLPPSLPGAVPDAPREGAASPVPRPPPQNELGSSSAPTAPPCGSAPFPHALAASGPAPAAAAVAQQRKHTRCDPSGACPNKRGRGSGAGVGSGGRPHPQGQRRPAHQQKKFQYGNYNKYYGYRNPGCSADPRLRVLQPEWFRGKNVLDLGCNTGHLTLFIARNWAPSRIVGLDIDSGLVHAARQNVRHYLSDLRAEEARRRPAGGGAEGRGPETGAEPGQREQAELAEARRRPPGGGAGAGGQGPETGAEPGQPEEAELEDGREAGSGEEGGAKERGRGEEVGGVAGEQRGGGGSGEGGAESAPSAGGGESNGRFPVSLRISRGPIAAPPLPDPPPATPGDFPANVSFVRGNYVLESDALLETQRSEYHVILCLSVSKWVHLNWGDAGLQRLFRRAYRHLLPGGVFILEPQPWSSYGRKRKLTDTIYKNYHSIRFKPDAFCSYLTSEVGFTSYELLGTPKSTSRGFERPVYKFYKGPSCPRK